MEKEAGYDIAELTGAQFVEVADLLEKTDDKDTKAQIRLMATLCAYSIVQSEMPDREEGPPLLKFSDADEVLNGMTISAIRRVSDKVLQINGLVDSEVAEGN